MSAKFKSFNISQFFLLTEPEQKPNMRSVVKILFKKLILYRRTFFWNKIVIPKNLNAFKGIF